MYICVCVKVREGNKKRKASSTTFNVFNDDIYNNGPKKNYGRLKKESGLR